MNYPLKSVQVLRGFAAIAVVLYHVDVLSAQHFDHAVFHFTYGALGVDLFFALSGFIITYIHFTDVREASGVRNFLTRRFIRIFPFYWLCILAVLLLHPDKYTGWLSVIKNIFLFRMPMSDLYISVSWSLTYEIIFYIAFAISIAIGWKWAKYIVPVWILLIIVNYGDTFANVMFVNSLFSNIIIEFLIGCVTGYLFVTNRINVHRTVIAGMVVFGIAAIAFLLHDRMNRFSLAMTSLIGFTASLTVLYGAMLDKSEDIHWRPSRVLVLIGDASYAIYLTHTIYLVYLFDLFGNFIDSTSSPLSKTAIIILIFFVSIISGVIIHLLMEKPLLVFLRKKAHAALPDRAQHKLHKV